ncbi:hypothetical protein [Mangrovimonas aestuarii]|uniref:hypothetical protein n=1 Tax=Mangrovimonas aestuarii TaxID=3018443 RepID=UPI002379149B|nr:hypothetical protein [Mangrovimonas aestuarii]
MIVNPKLFNYRIFTGTLIAVGLVVGSVVFSSYSELKNEYSFIKQEKELVEHELSEMIAYYEEMQMENELLLNKLQFTQYDIKRVMDSLEAITPSVVKADEYKEKWKALNLQHSTLKGTLNKVQKANDSLSVYLSVLNDLKKSSISNDLEPIKPFKQVRLKSLEVQALKYKGEGEFEFTRRVKHVQQLSVCFSLEDSSAINGNEENFYVQILGPKNNVIADKGEVRFGHSSLIYSSKLAPYRIKDLGCTIAKVSINESLSKGTYRVSLFYGENKLGGTTFELR